MQDIVEERYLQGTEVVERQPPAWLGAVNMRRQ